MQRYNDFKSYIFKKYGHMISDAIADYIYGVLHLNSNDIECGEIIIETNGIKALSCREEKPFIIMTITMDTGIRFLKDENEEKSSVREQSCEIEMRGKLGNGLHSVVVNRVELLPDNSVRKSDYNEYLLPPFGVTGIDVAGIMFIDTFCKEYFYGLGWSDIIKNMTRRYGMILYESDLPENEYGRMYFRSSSETVYIDDKPIVKDIVPGTIVISKNHNLFDMSGGNIHTILHEIIHWTLHRSFFEILYLLYEDDYLSCKFMPDILPAKMDDIHSAIQYAEWQANELAYTLLMPKHEFEAVMKTALTNAREMFWPSESKAMEAALIAVADYYHASDIPILIVKYRALQLGYLRMEGVFPAGEGEYHKPFCFAKRSLEYDQTYVLDEQGFERLYAEDRWFSELIDSGRFLYDGILVCINSPFYIEGRGSKCGKVELTEYALEHVDECCLKFKKQLPDRQYYPAYIPTFFYLTKNIDSESSKLFVTVPDADANYSVKEEEKQLRKMDENLSEILTLIESSNRTFTGLLDKCIELWRKEKKENTIEKLCERASLSKVTIGKYRSQEGSVKKRENVYALCVALGLHPYVSEVLIKEGVGEYPLTNEGLFAQEIIHNLRGRSLYEINEMLKSRGYKQWGES